MAHARTTIRARVRTILLNASTTAGTNVFDSRVYPHPGATLPTISVYVRDEEGRDAETDRYTQWRDATLAVEVRAQATSTVEQTIDTIDEEIGDPMYLNLTGDLIRGTGSTIITNNTFADSTGWTLESPWTVTGGAASIDGSQVGTADMTWTGTNLNANWSNSGGSRQLTLRYSVTRNAGTLTVLAGSESLATVSSTVVAQESSFIQRVSDGASQIPTFRADANFDGTVDNVYLFVSTPLVKEVSFQSFALEIEDTNEQPIALGTITYRLTYRVDASNPDDVIL